jgi:hypothetical protein
MNGQTLLKINDNNKRERREYSRHTLKLIILRYLIVFSFEGFFCADASPSLMEIRTDQEI